MKEKFKKQITEYHKKLKNLAHFDYHSDQFVDYEWCYDFHPNLYKDDVADEGLKQIMLIKTVYEPVFKILSFIRENGHFEVDTNQLGNEYMIRDEEVIGFLQYASPRHRRLLLDGFTIPTGSYTDISEGIIDLNVESLKRAVAKVDVSGLYKKIAFIDQLRFELAPRLRSPISIKLWNETLIAYTTSRKWKHSLDETPVKQNIAYDDLCAATKQMISNCYIDDGDSYAGIEAEEIEELINGNKLFKDFYYEIPRHKTAIVKMEPSRVMEAPKEKVLINDDIIMGVAGLASWIGCSNATAQKIVNKKILQKRGILYYQGRFIRIKKDKLDDLLAREPEIFKNL